MSAEITRTQITTWSIPDGDEDGGVFEVTHGDRWPLSARWVGSLDGRPTVFAWAPLNRVELARHADAMLTAGPGGYMAELGDSVWFTECQGHYQYTIRLGNLFARVLADLESRATLAPWA